MTSRFSRSPVQSAKHYANRILEVFDLKVINARWGPRGFLPVFQRIASSGIKPRWVVDAGAARGEWTRECLMAFPDAHYLLVEPLEENHAAIRALTAENPRIAHWFGALGATAGTLRLNVHGDQSSFFPSEYDSRQVREVPVRTLDSFVANELPEPPGLIKADVQGYELEVLRGAEHCLRSAEFVLLEVSFRQIYHSCPLADDVIAFMDARGFRIHSICSFAERPKDRELAQADILFASETSRVFEFEGYA